jgi:hypothetical protein
MGRPEIHHGDLFGWSNGRVVLLVNREETSWIVARGWCRGDRLGDVRRWRFDSELRATGQLRRLVEEATGDPPAAAFAAEELTGWLVSRSRTA